MFSLKTIRANAQERRIPIISEQTESFLQQELEKHQPKHCFEIGSAIWYSTIFIASIIQKRGGQITSFEISYPAYREALRNIKESSLWNCTLYPRDILTIDPRKLVPGTCDFFFIDGQKSQYGEYMQKVEGIKAENTLTIIDDVIKYHEKLSSLYEYLQKKQISYQILPMEEGDGIMLLKD